MLKIKKLSCIILAGALSIGALAFTACEEENKENSGGNGVEITQQPLNKPTVPDGVELTEVTDCEEIEKCLYKIYKFIQYYDYNATEPDRVCTYSLYGNRQIINELSMGEDEIDGVDYSYVDSALTTGREFSAEMQCLSRGEEQAANFNFEFIKSQSYKDNLPATQDYSKSQRQDFCVNYSNGVANTFFNNNLAESLPESDLPCNKDEYGLFTFGNVTYQFNEIFDLINGYELLDVFGGGTYIGQLIDNAITCNAYNAGKVSYPIYDYENMWKVFMYCIPYCDFDDDDEWFEAQDWDYYREKIKVEKHGLRLKTNGKQYWLEADIKLVLPVPYESDRTKTKTYNYMLYLDTQPELNSQEIEKSVTEENLKNVLRIECDESQAQKDLAAGKDITVELIGNGEINESFQIISNYDLSEYNSDIDDWVLSCYVIEANKIIIDGDKVREAIQKRYLDYGYDDYYLWLVLKYKSTDGNYYSYSRLRLTFKAN